MSRASSQIVWVLLAVLLFGVAIALLQQRGLPPRFGVEDDRIAIDLGGARFRAELAVDFASQTRGLGGRERIDPEGGMLFVYPQPEPLVFVMRDCLAPIDIAFLDAEGRVVSMHTMVVEPPRQPWETMQAYQARLRLYPSEQPAQFVFETAAGRFAELGVGVGDRARFDRQGVVAMIGRVAR